MRKATPFFQRALGAGLLLVLGAACAPATTTSSTEPAATSPVYPRGIVRFKDAPSAESAGLYAGNSRNCCFMGKHTKVLLDKPAGRLRATFTFYVPKVEPYASGESITVTAGGKSASGSTNENGARWITLTLALPDQYKAQTTVPVEIVASKSFVPKKLGINGDPRDLSVEFARVEYP